MVKGKVSIKGANAADKQNIAAARKANRTRATAQTDEMPEAKKTPAAKSAAAAKVFNDTDEAVGLTVEQQEAGLRRAVFGY